MVRRPDRRVDSRVAAAPRRCRRVCSLLVASALAGCGASRPSGPDTSPPAAPASAAAARLDGEEILQRVCTQCHDLGGLDAYADYWGEREWRSLIDTMVTYGAELDAQEYEVLARYLAEHYGPAAATAQR